MREAMGCEPVAAEQRGSLQHRGVRATCMDEHTGLCPSDQTWAVEGTEWIFKAALGKRLEGPWDHHNWGWAEQQQEAPPASGKASARSRACGGPQRKAAVNTEPVPGTGQVLPNRRLGSAGTSELQAEASA